MKSIKHRLGIAVLGLSLSLTVGFSAFASAAPIFVGSWNLYSGPSYLDVLPPLYTGQQAAAFLFGGSAGDYLISTAGSDADAIDFLAWYDQYGLGQARFAQDYLKDSGIAGIYDATADASAMVRDHYYEEAGAYPYVNYAFRLDAGSEVPEPMSVGLLGAGLLGMGLLRRKRAARR
jgi:hypothetical protein